MLRNVGIIGCFLLLGASVVHTATCKADVLTASVDAAEMTEHALVIESLVQPDASKAVDRRVLVPLTAGPIGAGKYKLNLLLQCGPEAERVELMTETRGGSASDGVQILRVDPAKASQISVPVLVEASDTTTWRGKFTLRVQARKDASRLRVVIGRFQLVRDGDEAKPVAQLPIKPEADMGSTVQFNPGLTKGTASVMLSNPMAQREARQMLTLITDHPYQIWTPADAHPPRLLIDNQSDVEMSGTLEVDLQAYARPVVPGLRQAIRLEPGKQSTIALPRPERLGLVFVRARLMKDKEVAREWSDRFAAVDAVGPAKALPDLRTAFFLGTANGARIGEDDDETKRLIAASALLGARYTRMTRHWAQVEPKPGEYKWERSDLIANEARRYNMQLQLVIGPPPRWAVDRQYGPEPEKSSTLPPDLELYRGYLQQLVARYADRVGFYEVWNEPDIGFYNGTLEQYLNVLRVSHEVVSQLDPDGLVMTGGFTGFVHPGRKPGFQETVVRDAQSNYDIHTLHMHGVFDNYWNQLTQRVMRFREAAGVNKPLAFNETGMDTRFGAAHQASTLPKKIAAARFAGARVYAWYSITDHPKSKDDANKMGFSYGLIDTAGRPKPSLVTYATAARYIGEHDSKFVERWTFAPDADDARFGFVFARADGTFATILWSEDSSTGEAVVAVRLPEGASVEIVDMMGNRTPLPVQGGRVLVPVRREPGYLVTSARPNYEQVLLTARQEIGAEVPSARIVTTDAAGQWKIGNDGMSDREGGQASVWSLPLASSRAPDTDATHGVVHYRFNDVVAGELNVPMQSPVVLSNARGVERPADFEIRRTEQVFNRFEHDPNTADRLWQGPDDASAKVWIERSETEWILSVEVTDDRRLCAHDGTDIVRGDSIEWTLKPAGTDEGVAFALGTDTTGKTLLLSRPIGEKDWKLASPQTASAQTLSPTQTLYTVRVRDAAIVGARQWELDLRLNDADSDKDLWESRLSLQSWAEEKPLGKASVWLRLK